MEEEAPSRRSVAELAGRFTGAAPPNDAAKNETEKPVRRRPPRSLQLAKTTGDEQETPPEVTSPGPGKPKRNSALIEKLQANLVLSPTNMCPPLKSPGVRLLPFPGSAPETTATASSTATPTSPVLTVFPSASQEEGPTSFEAPPTVADGSILPSINKGRARHSIRRRPPSRRHRKSSAEDDGGDTPLTSPTEPDGKTVGEGGEEKEGGGGGGAEEDKKEGPEEDGSPKEDQLKNGDELQGEEKKEEEKKEEKKAEKKEEEKKEEEDGEKMETEEDNQENTSAGKQEEEPMNVDSKEEKMEETTCPSST